MLSSQPPLRTWTRSATDMLAFIAFPREIWRQVWSNKPLRHEVLLDRMEVEDLTRWAVAPA